MGKKLLFTVQIYEQQQYTSFVLRGNVTSTKLFQAIYLLENDDNM